MSVPVFLRYCGTQTQYSTEQLEMLSVEGEGTVISRKMTLSASVPRDTDNCIVHKACLPRRPSADASDEKNISFDSL